MWFVFICSAYNAFIPALQVCPALSGSQLICSENVILFSIFFFQVLLFGIMIKKLNYYVLDMYVCLFLKNLNHNALFFSVKKLCLKIWDCRLKERGSEDKKKSFWIVFQDILVHILNFLFLQFKIRFMKWSCKHYLNVLNFVVK